MQFRHSVDACWPARADREPPGEPDRDQQRLNVNEARHERIGRTLEVRGCALRAGRRSRALRINTRTRKHQPGSCKRSQAVLTEKHTNHRVTHRCVRAGRAGRAAAGAHRRIRESDRAGLHKTRHATARVSTSLPGSNGEECTLHAGVPTSEANVPIGQGLHCVSPLPLAALPTSQGMQNLQNSDPYRSATEWK